MKYIHLFTVLGLITHSEIVFAQDVPSVTFAPGTAAQLFGLSSPEALKNVLNCDMLANQTWPFPNAQVSPVCLDATTACVRYGLLQQDYGRSTGERQTAIRNTLPLAKKDAEMKLLGCVIGIEGTINGNMSLPNASGY